MKKLVYNIFHFFVKLFYPKTKIAGSENLPTDAGIIVANHTQMNGPIIGILYYPRKRSIWCNHEMMELKEVPDYAFNDFWINKPKSVRWFFRGLSYVIAPLAVCIFNTADTIAVYRDKRIVKTINDSIEALNSGKDVIIFPESPVEHNNIVCEFQTGFVDVARRYNKKTGKELYFIPMYIAPALKTAYIGKPVQYNSENKVADEKIRICDYLMDEITGMARSLPQHKVVPYSNIPKDQYPLNK